MQHMSNLGYHPRQLCSCGLCRTLIASACACLACMHQPCRHCSAHSAGDLIAEHAAVLQAADSKLLLCCCIEIISQCTSSIADGGLCSKPPIDDGVQAQKQAKPAAAQQGKAASPNEASNPREIELLKGISGVFRPGVLTALMGASGAGRVPIAPSARLLWCTLCCAFVIYMNICVSIGVGSKPLQHSMHRRSACTCSVCGRWTSHGCCDIC